MFKKVLIANRGEIAVRVIRACREMGIASVAVYSDVDRASLHVRKADEAYHIGPATATESYLNIAKILDVAKRSGAEAIHPGYGFLSENANFARACADAGIKFIGPTGDAMDTMGSKTRARQAMSKADVPFVPGTLRGLEYSETEIKAAGNRLSRHAEGRGGRRRQGHAHGALASGAASPPSRRRAARPNVRSATARSTSRNTSSIRATWRCRSSPTSTATCVYLGERECSVQRRHQKVLEESPSPIVDRRNAPAYGRDRSARRQSRRLHQRRHGRVPRRPATATSTSSR